MGPDDFFWSGILKDFIQVWKEKGEFAVCSCPPQTSYHEVSRRSRAVNVEEM